MNKIGIFFGSDTGNTENIAKLIHKYIGNDNSTLHDISESSRKEIEQFNYLIFGIPTWYYGELQCDWDDFLPILKKINFSDKTVALFGCGDQEDYSEYFCDGMSIIYNVVKKNHGKMIGHWPVQEYVFEKSKALLNDKYFMGLILDEDRQPEKTKIRIKKWLQFILPHFS